ncbi:MAG: NYN domain-containing protein [Patescibacteria group bacterium]|jgi:uncharacterized LabA/DUF88 family protein
MESNWRTSIEKETAIMVYLDVANIIGWQKRLGWKIRIVRLIEQLRAMNNVREVKAYYGTNERAKAQSDAFNRDVMKSGAILRTKPVKFIRKTIDLGMFFKKMTLNQLDLGTTTLVNSVVEAVQSSGTVIEEPKCNFDVEITMDLMDDVERASGFMLFSGDSDFYAPLERLKLKGKHVYVVGARGAVAGELFRVADAYIDIGKLYQR